MIKDSAKALVEAKVLQQEDVDGLDAETLLRLNEVTGGRLIQDLQDAKRGAESSNGADGDPKLFF